MATTTLPSLLNTIQHALSSNKDLVRARALAVVAAARAPDDARPVALHYELCVREGDWRQASHIVTRLARDSCFCQQAVAHHVLHTLLQDASSAISNSAEYVDFLHLNSKKVKKDTPRATGLFSPATLLRGKARSFGDKITADRVASAATMSLHERENEKKVVFDRLTLAAQGHIVMALVSDVSDLCVRAVLNREPLMALIGPDLARTLAKTSTPSNLRMLAIQLLPKLISQSSPSSSSSSSSPPLSPTANSSDGSGVGGCSHFSADRPHAAAALNEQELYELTLAGAQAHASAGEWNLGLCVLLNLARAKGLDVPTSSSASSRPDPVEVVKELAPAAAAAAAPAHKSKWGGIASQSQGQEVAAIINFPSNRDQLAHDLVGYCLSLLAHCHIHGTAAIPSHHHYHHQPQQQQQQQQQQLADLQPVQPLDSTRRSRMVLLSGIGSASSTSDRGCRTSVLRAPDAGSAHREYAIVTAAWQMKEGWSAAAEAGWLPLHLAEDCSDSVSDNSICDVNDTEILTACGLRWCDEMTLLAAHVDYLALDGWYKTRLRVASLKELHDNSYGGSEGIIAEEEAMAMHLRSADAALSLAQYDRATRICLDLLRSLHDLESLMACRNEDDMPPFAAMKRPRTGRPLHQTLDSIQQQQQQQQRGGLPRVVDLTRAGMVREAMCILVQCAIAYHKQVPEDAIIFSRLMVLLQAAWPRHQTLFDDLMANVVIPRGKSTGFFAFPDMLHRVGVYSMLEALLEPVLTGDFAINMGAHDATAVDKQQLHQHQVENNGELLRQFRQVVTEMPSERHRVASVLAAEVKRKWKGLELR